MLFNVQFLIKFFYNLEEIIFFNILKGIVEHFRTSTDPNGSSKETQDDNISSLKWGTKMWVNMRFDDISMYIVVIDNLFPNVFRKVTFHEKMSFALILSTSITVVANLFYIRATAENIIP